VVVVLVLVVVVVVVRGRVCEVLELVRNVSGVLVPSEESSPSPSRPSLKVSPFPDAGLVGEEAATSESAD
jgi:hypothetical protein